MVDDDSDGSNFIMRELFCRGGARQEIAMRVVSQFGEESTKVVGAE